jgi:hypothetical protein
MKATRFLRGICVLGVVLAWFVFPASASENQEGEEITVTGVLLVGENRVPLVGAIVQNDFERKITDACFQGITDFLGSTRRLKAIGAHREHTFTDSAGRFTITIGKALYDKLEAKGVKLYVIAQIEGSPQTLCLRRAGKPIVITVEPTAVEKSQLVTLIEAKTKIVDLGDVLISKEQTR